MATDETYNGWSNRETWAINLHLSNNEGDYRQMCEQAETIVNAFGSDKSLQDRMISRMADYIKDWTEEVFDSVLNPEDGIATDNGVTFTTPEARMFVTDVGSWWRADFYEIAEHWIDDAIEAVGNER